jgi:hypothetical protein
MTLNELLIIMENRLLSLHQAKVSAALAGEPDKVVQIEADITSTKTSVAQIKKALIAPTPSE